MRYRLLEAFEALFSGKAYLHRSPTHGDRVAVELYEDLFVLNRSPSFAASVRRGACGVNVANRATGIAARRGDGSFGELLPHAVPVSEPDHAVMRGPIANIQIGVETKILATAIGKQVQERISSLIEQAQQFRARNPDCICVAIVGVNHAPAYVAYDGSRTTPTDGTKYPHPIQQAPAAMRKVHEKLKSVFDEVLALPFVATNISPFAFSWVDDKAVEDEYGAALIRLSQTYERRFPSPAHTR